MYPWSLCHSCHSLALCEKLVTALNTNETHTSKRVKTRLDCNNNLLTVCQDIITHAAKNDHNKDDEDNCDDTNTNDNDNGNWIGCLVDQPDSEQNRKP